MRALIHGGIGLVMVVVVAGMAQAADRYVWLGGSNNPPYQTWADAATNIQTAVDAASAGETVWVTNGTYGITNQIVVTNGLAVRSFNNDPVNTVVQRSSGSIRIFMVSNTAAAVSGFTIKGGATPASAGVGGGLYLFAGTVSNCIVTGNSIGSYNKAGGVYMGSANALLVNSTVQSNTVGHDCSGAGVYMDGGVALNCVIRYNTGSTGNSQGAGVNAAGGTVRNCLIYSNVTTAASYAYGGGVCNGTVENCTIYGNKANDGGGTYNASVKNSIVYGNVALIAATPNYSGGSFSFSCTTPSVAGTGNTAADPLLLDPAALNFRLRPASPCINSGTNLAWMAGAKDLDGNARILPGGGTNDMGVYEYQAGPLLCSFSGTPVTGFASNSVVFTAAVDGTNLDTVGYYWDFQNDGAVELQGTDKQVVTNLYTVGLYSVKLTVSNAVGESSSMVRPNYIKVTPAEVYVSTNGSNTSPFTNWVTAATNLQSAFALAASGTVVRISNGVYSISSTLTVDYPATVVGVGGPSNTVVQPSGGTMRVLILSDPNALLSGLTIRNGSYGPGGGVNMSAGTISNCIISGNTVGYNSTGGGGIYMSGANALVVASTIENNNLGQDNYGGGIRMTAGLVRNCVIRNNAAGVGTSGGGGVYASGGTIRNCLICSNSALLAGANAYGGGVWGGSLENCTVSSNMATDGGGIYGSTVTNSIVYFNIATLTANHNYSGGAFMYSCTTPAAAGVGNTSADPTFVSVSSNNYRLKTGSPCIDAGTNLAWMAGAKDLGGSDRIIPAGGTNDMGAYEYSAGPLSCSFVGTPTAGFLSNVVVFTASADGTNMAGVTYYWDFENDGTGDAQGADKKIVTNTYAVGLYSVKLTVSNAIGESAVFLQPNYIKAAPAVLYVATNGSQTAPYTSWAAAASNIQAGIDMAYSGTVVRVTNGLYVVSRALAIDSVSGPIRLESVGGPSNTVVQQLGGNTRVLSVSAPGAFVSGFTLTGGSVPAHASAGGGLALSAGTVSNCLITGNILGGYSSGGGGVYMGSANAYLIACTVQSNSMGQDNYGGGIYMAGGLALNCVVRYNSGAPGTCYGGGIYASAGTARNCLIYSNVNTAAGTAYGGGAAGGVLESCTICSNLAINGGGVYNSTVTNSIIYFNAITTGSGTNYSGGALSYCCTFPAPGGTGNITNDPQFVNAARPDYRLLETSPCVDAGTNLAWMIGAKDLAGSPRIDGRAPLVVDMGAYEFIPPPRGTILMVR